VHAPRETVSAQGCALTSRRDALPACLARGMHAQSTPTRPKERSFGVRMRGMPRRGATGVASAGLEELRVDQVAEAVDDQEVDLLDSARALGGNANLDVVIAEHARDRAAVTARERDDA